MATIDFTYLEPLHPRIERFVRDEVPRDWRLNFVREKGFEAQRAGVRDAELLFLIGSAVPAKLIDAAPRLRFVQKLGAGVDNIDLAACARRGIGVAKASGGNAIPVAEHTVMLMLAALRRLPLVDRATRAGAWPKEEARGIHRQIHGRRVGIVGLGAIGGAVARLLQGFGAELVFTDPDPKAVAAGRAQGLRDLPLDELLASSDIVTLHVPLQADTRDLIDARRIAAMKPGAVLVNCARGGLVDEAALLAALNEGRLMGAGLDVFAIEPPMGTSLLASDAVVVTPHLAGATFDNFVNVLRHGIANALAFLEKRPLPPGDLVAS